MIETYVDIIGYEGLYKISNLGRIKSFKRYNYGKLMSNNSFDKDGYLKIGLIDTLGKRKHYRIHRLVALAFIDNPNKYEFINHKDNNPSNNSMDNLEWCSLEYNNSYRFYNGNANHKGESHPQTKLTDDVVKQIYILGHSGNYTESQIADTFNTTRSVVNKIRLKYTWTHVTNLI